MSQPLPTQRRGMRLGIAVLIFAAAFLVYSPALTGEFLSWDDLFTIAQNPRLNPPTISNVLKFWPPIVRANPGDDALTAKTYTRGVWRVNHVYGLYIPATYTAWSALAGIAQTRGASPGTIELNPWIFHAANVALHAAATLVVFALLRRLVATDWPALAGAMLFLLHPVQVESVAWIDGMKDVLCGLLSLIALWQHVAAVQTTEQRARRKHHALATVAFVFALLAKPSAVTVPLLAIVLDVLALGRPLRRSVLAAIPWLALSLVFGVLAALAQPATDVTPARLWARPLVVGDAIAFYLWKLTWPLRLGVDYGRRPDALIGNWWFYSLWLVPTVLLLIAWKLRRRNSLLLAGLLIFILAPLPTLGLTTFLFQQFSTTADHYLYLALLGASLAVASLLASIQTERAKKLGWVAIAVLLIGCAVRSWLQAHTWRTDQSLFANAVAVNPDSFVAHNNLGSALRNDDPSAAEREFLRAHELEPNRPEPARSLADLYTGEGRREDAAKWRAEQQRLEREHPRR